MKSDDDSDGLRIIFASYREWTYDVGNFLHDHPRISTIAWAETQEQLSKLLTKHAHETDLVMLCGWSWPPEQWMVNTGPLIVTEHPAASDRYSPGTPLQNQIIDGLRTTKHRIVKVGHPELSPRLWSHEVDMSLEGHMDHVLQHMRSTSMELYRMFLEDYPKIVWKQWPEDKSCMKRPRRTPEMSDITRMLQCEDERTAIRWLPTTTQRLYDMIRCLEAPYPNAFIEDNTGRLYFERVRFEPK